MTCVELSFADRAVGNDERSAGRLSTMPEASVEGVGPE